MAKKKTKNKNNQNPAVTVQHAKKNLTNYYSSHTQLLF